MLFAKTQKKRKMSLKYLHHHETPLEQQLEQHLLKPVKFENIHNKTEPDPSIYWHPNITEYYNSKYFFLNHSIIEIQLF